MIRPLFLLLLFIFCVRALPGQIGGAHYRSGLTLELQNLLPSSFQVPSPSESIGVQDFEKFSSLFLLPRRKQKAFGSQYKNFFKAIPKEEMKVLFVSDRLFDREDPAVFDHYVAQAFAVPSLLIPNTEMLTSEEYPDYAIIYCSSEQIAQEWLSKLGYSWKKRMSSSQGVARKNTLERGQR